MLDIVIAAHRLVDAEGTHETCNRRSHTVACVGIKIVGTETSLHQLGSSIAFPNCPLAGTEHGQGIRPLCLERSLGFLFHDIESLFPGNRCEFAIFVVLAVGHPQHRRLETVTAIHDLGEEVALDAVQATIDRRIRVALGCYNLSVLCSDQNTTAGTAETAWSLVPANFVFARSGNCRRTLQPCCRHRRRCCIGFDEFPSIEFHASTSSLSDSLPLY